jgi:molecular chaperone GrpE
VTKTGNGRGGGDVPDPAGRVRPEEEAEGPSEQGGASPEEEGASSDETGLEAVAEPDELAALRKERDELKDALLRRRAEFENYRRRVERDRSVAATEASAAIFGKLVETVDNLERALAAAGTEGSLRQGVELTYRELLVLLDSHGVSAIDPSGERFDPSLHQALLHEPAEGFEDGTVAEVLRKGYRYRDRLLRPALVKVASGSGERSAQDGGGEDLL